MGLSVVINKLARPFFKLGKKLGHVKPEIVMGAGIIAVTAGFIWMAVEARKIDKVMEEGTERLEEAQNKYDTQKVEHPEEYNEQEEKKELSKIRFGNVIDMTRIFAGPTLVFIGGLILIVKGHKILRVMYAAQGVALKATEEMFKYYRRNNIAENGPEADERFMNGKIKVPEEQTVTLEDGTEKTIVAETVKDNDIEPVENPYRILFCSDNFRTFENDPDRNLFFLQGEFSYFSRKYDTEKFKDISLYEVLNELGYKWDKLDGKRIDKKKKMFYRRVGWGHDKNGDNYISFGLDNEINNAARRRQCSEVWLEFNCDGYLDTVDNIYEEKYGL